MEDADREQVAHHSDGGARAACSGGVGVEMSTVRSYIRELKRRSQMAVSRSSGGPEMPLRSPSPR